MADGNSHAPQPPPFPLSVDPFRGGWCVTVHQQNGQRWYLLKPGWSAETADPYVFCTAAEGWAFLRKVFLFCTRQHNPHNDMLCNCPSCGKVYRGRFLTACEDCTMTNDYLMQQIWQGLYYMSGSYDEVIARMAMLLNISPDKLLNIKSAYAMLVNQNENQNEPPRWHSTPFEEEEDPGKLPLLKRNARRASSRRRHNYGLRGK